MRVTASASQPGRRLILALCLAAILTLPLAHAAAALGWGDGRGGPDPDHPCWAKDKDATCVWRSDLFCPALQMNSCPWLDHALNHQGWKTENGWTINKSQPLNSTITIDEYYAWVTNRPKVTNRHGNEYGGGATGRIGGAVIDLNYDGTIANARWIQVIRTNCPSDYGRDNGYATGDGYYEYIDCALNPAGDAFYDPKYAAGPDWFIDIPTRVCNCPCSLACDWDAQVFLATGVITGENKSLTFYEKGVWWGFEFKCVPEPSSLIALLGACVPFVVLVRRRR